MSRSLESLQEAARLISCLACVYCLAVGVFAAPASAPITVTIDPSPTGPEIPEDFLGLSFGMKTLLPNSEATRFFSPTNTPLVTLLQNIGIRHLRMGGTTVESPPTTPVPGREDIDSLFALVKAARVKRVIYSLPLLETNASLRYDMRNAELAKYIWDHYRDRLDAFSLGNEPDLHRVYYQDVSITNFTTYLSKWQRFARAITNAAPGARFAGPDAGSGNVSWTTQFSRAAKDFGCVTTVTEHFYVGGAGRDVAAPDGIKAMLSREWVDRNQALYEKVGVPVSMDRLPLRFTEANDHYSGGARDASDTFSGALWALDFLHWWAAHNVQGVNFHNTQWVVNDVITPDSSGRLGVNPKAYGLKAFELGSHGRVERVSASNPLKINLTAYAVKGPRDHFLTLINKDYGPDGMEANVRLAGIKTTAGAAVIFLESPGRDVAVKSGVTLGGASITADRPWAGKWRVLRPSQAEGFEIKVPPATAAVLKIPRH